MSGVFAMRRRSSRLMCLASFLDDTVRRPPPPPKKTGPFPDPPPASLSAPRRYSRSLPILHYGSGPHRAEATFPRSHQRASADREPSPTPRHVRSTPEAGGWRSALWANKRLMQSSKRPLGSMAKPAKHYVALCGCCADRASRREKHPHTLVITKEAGMYSRPQYFRSSGCSYSVWLTRHGASKIAMQPLASLPPNGVEQVVVLVV